MTQSHYSIPIRRGRRDPSRTMDRGRDPAGKVAMALRESSCRMEERLPLSLRAIRIDGGSEFKAEFEAYCQERCIQFFVSPQRSPKLNGMVERLLSGATGMSSTPVSIWSRAWNPFSLLPVPARTPTIQSALIKPSTTAPPPVPGRSGGRCMSGVMHQVNRHNCT